MRSAYGAQLAALTDELAAVCRLVGTAMERATHALLHADLAVAEEVIGGLGVFWPMRQVEYLGRLV